MKTQTKESLVHKVNEGDRVVFNLGNEGGLAPQDWGLDSEEEMTQITDHDGQQATVTGIAIDDGDPASKIVDGPFYVDIKFDDGFELSAVDGYHLTPVSQTQRGEPVAHDFIPSGAEESVDKQARNLMRKVMERTRGKISEEGGPFAPGGLDDQAASFAAGNSQAHDIDAQAVNKVMEEVSQWHAGQMQDLLEALAGLYSDHDMLLNMDAPAIQKHLQEAARLLGERTGD